MQGFNPAYYFLLHTKRSLKTYRSLLSSQQKNCTHRSAKKRAITRAVSSRLGSTKKAQTAPQIQGATTLLLQNQSTNLKPKTC
ncbi:hypothetical protein [Kingella negevensis]|uniref:hypothetical protein n=1 Tax=Kingella negevensis TaxID=1522312 RepID=UPI000421F0C7|nr:hypothetical protein [Kingella negevensis]MDK4688134.1 hypothetical protein [Kingella negevensis]WII90880.1 hypothetical protein QEO93_10845 [Kingella negevensis]